MTIEELKQKLNYYYKFCEIGMKYLPNFKHKSKEEQINFAIYNGFFCSLSNYILLIVDDIENISNFFFPKSNVNKALLRISIEAALLLDVLHNRPELIDKYYETYQSDIERLDCYFKGVKSTQSFVRRFSWLPRYKHRKATSVSDLLNFVEFENENHKEYYHILLHHLDTYTHPSFHIAQSIDSRTKASIELVASLFTEGGIVYELCFNMVDGLEGNSDLFNMKNELLDVLNQRKDDDVLLKKYQESLQKLPQEINPIGYIIAQASINIQSKEKLDYKDINIAYLLIDLAPRYEDLLRAYFSKNVLLFESQLRTVLESFALIHILLKENEKRSEIFHAHQSIKNYEANKSAIDLLKTLKLPISDDSLNNEQEESISKIKDFYLTQFNKEVSDKDITRLYGWALYLKNIDNEKVPNAYFLIDNLIKDFFRDPIRTEINALFEESNAFTHLTIYAFINNNKNINPDIIKICNSLLEKIILSIYSVLNINNINEEQKKEVEIYFPQIIEKLNLLALNNFQ